MKWKKGLDRTILLCTRKESQGDMNFSVLSIQMEESEPSYGDEDD
jgi:hypothetical protein